MTTRDEVYMEMVSPFDRNDFYGDITRVDAFWSPRRVYRALVSTRKPLDGDGQRAISISSQAVKLFRLRRTQTKPSLVSGRVIRIVRDLVEIEREETW